MQKRTLLWLVPGLLYLLFVAWYTDLGGPLTADEIAGFTEKLRANGGSEERIARIREFMQADTGRQFLMVNVIDMNENPPDVPGAAPGESARQLMDRYMEHMYPALLQRACHPVLMGTAIFSNMDTVGVTGADNWTMGALMRYRSRRSMMEIVTNPAFMGSHEFKLAALDKTIAYPIEMNLYYSDLRLMLGLMLLAVTALLDILLFGRADKGAAP
jgi:hypothetical protein